MRSKLITTSVFRFSQQRTSNRDILFSTNIFIISFFKCFKTIIYLSFIQLKSLLSICLSVYLSICLSVYLSICLSAYLSICLSVYLSICLLICLHVYLDQVCLSNLNLLNLNKWLEIKTIINFCFHIWISTQYTQFNKINRLINSYNKLLPIRCLIR